MAIATLAIPATTLVAGSFLLANGALLPGPPEAHSVEVLGTFARDVSASGSARTSTAYRIRVRSWRDDREHEDLHGGNDFPVELFDLIEEGLRLQASTAFVLGWWWETAVRTPTGARLLH